VESLKKIKIAYLLDSYSTQSGGTEGQFRLLLSHLDRDRFAPQVLLLRDSPEIAHAVSGIKTQTLGIGRLSTPRSIARILRISAQLSRSGVRIAHIFFNDASLVFPLPLAALGIKVVISRRDLGFWYSRANLRILRLNRHYVHAVIANCKAVADVVRREERYEPERIHVIHNGITRSASILPRAEARAMLGLESDSKIVITVANLRPLKRTDDAIRVIARLKPRFRKIVFLVIGQDTKSREGTSHMSELKTLSQQLGLNTEVQFLGLVKDPTPLIAASDVCLHCSGSEGLSNSIIEYMLLGRPVVCACVGGNKELVEDGRSGFLVPIGEISELAEKVGTILDDGILGERLGKEARSFALRNFNPDRLISQHQTLYWELCFPFKHASEKSI